MIYEVLLFVFSEDVWILCVLFWLLTGVKAIFSAVKMILPGTRFMNKERPLLTNEPNKINFSSTSITSKLFETWAYWSIAGDDRHFWVLGHCDLNIKWRIKSVDSNNNRANHNNDNNYLTTINYVLASFWI